MNEILEISKYLIELETAAQEKHWQEQAARIENQRIEAEKYDLKTLVETKYKRKRKHIIQTTLNFASDVIELFDDNEEHPLSYQNNDNFSSTYSMVNFYKMINNLKTFNILDEVNSHYDNRISLAKTYFFNFPNFLQFKNQAFDLYHIISQYGGSHPHKSLEYAFGLDNRDDSEFENLEKIEFDKSKIFIRSHMMMNVTGISNERIIAALEERYPQVPYYAKIVDTLNKSRPNEDKIKFKFTLKFRTKNGKRYLTKIGFRASSPLCNYKEHENANPFFMGKWRKDYFIPKYGNYDHYDVNASIYRLTYNLNHDEALGFDQDVYEMMYGHKFESKEDRDAYKRICMRLMFGKINQLGNQVERRLSKLEDKQYDRARREVIQDTMSEAKINMYEALGSSYDSEIFLHESCIYVDMLSKMLNNQDVSLVYDCFYYKSDYKLDIDDFNTLYLSSLNSYKNMFSSSIKPLVKLDDLYHIISQYGGSTKSMKKQTRKQKIDNSDIPEELVVDKKYLETKQEIIKSIKACVKNELMSINTANKLSSELNLEITFRNSDQPLGFSVSRESQLIYSYWMRMLPKLKSYLKIN